MLEFETVCSVLSILPDAVVVIDMQQRIRYCNEVAESMFRYAPGELKGQRLTVSRHAIGTPMSDTSPNLPRSAASA